MRVSSTASSPTSQIMPAHSIRLQNLEVADPTTIATTTTSSAMPSYPDADVSPTNNISSSSNTATDRPDEGRGALTMLVGCSVLQLPIWGFVMSYGVLQEQYATHLSLANANSDTGATGVIGTTLNGVLYMSLPILSTLFASRWYHWRRTAAVLGLLLSSAGLIISASSTAVWHLVVTQGILCGIGSALVYSPTTLYLDDWWIRRKSYALSVLLAAKNIVGTGTPFLTPALIDHVGLQNTLRIWGVITAVSGIAVMPFLRPRLDGFRRRDRQEEEDTHPRSLSASSSSKTPWAFLKHQTFYVFLIANIVFSSGYGLPQTYLPSYARQVLSLPTAQGALMLALFNIPGIFSCIGAGILGDGRLLFGRYSMTPYTLTFVSAFGSALATFLLWGLAARTSVGGLAVFSIIYGFFASAYSSTWGGALRQMQQEAAVHNEAIDTGVVYGLFNGGRGIGYVVGGIAGTELLKLGSIRESSHTSAFDTDFGSVIMFTGISAVVGGWSILWTLKGHMRRVI